LRINSGTEPRRKYAVVTSSATVKNNAAIRAADI
jgi:hypothetical protein